MIINSTNDEETLTISLQGIFDYAAAAEFKEYTQGGYKGVWELVFDLSELDYISSAGMRVLLESELIMKKRGGMKLVNVNEEVMGVIKMAGFDRFLNIV